MWDRMIHILVDHYSVLVEILGLLLLIPISTHVPEMVKRMTRHALYLQVGVAVCYHLEEWTQSFQTLSMLRPVLTALAYSLYPLILVFMIRIILMKKLPRRRLILLLLPELVCIPLYFTSQWTHLVCWFTPDNRYTPGPLRSLPYIVVAFYSMVFLYHNICYFKKFNRRDRLAAAYAVVVPLIGMVALRLLRDDGDYSALLISSIVIYYVFFYIHMAKIDSLTSLLNRKCCYEDIQTKAKTITAVVSVDMNNLKYFSDNLGHQAGDEALKAIAEVLRNHCGRKGTTYRVGGDEFIILYSASEDNAVRNAISEMRENLSKTPYSCAFGYAMRKPGKSVESAIAQADQAMYADKATIKLKQKQESHARGRS